MAAPEGNTFAKKLSTLELKEEAYKQYLQHLEEGWPKEAWCFEHPDMTLTWQTMETYIKAEPDVFKSFLMSKAMSKRYKYWLKEGKTLMTGGYQHGSPVVWQTMMRNMFKEYKWDAKELIQENGPTEPVKAIIDDMGKLNAGTSIQPQTDSELSTGDEKD